MKKALVLIITFFAIIPSVEASQIVQPLPGINTVKIRSADQEKKVSAITQSGKRRGFLLLQRRNDWFVVRAPLRPNKSRYRIHSSRAKVVSWPNKILVDISQRKLYYFRSGRYKWSSTVVVGKKATPTPRGRFALDDFYRSRGDTRPWVFKTTAHSRALRSWKGGPARIALHGRHGSLQAPLGEARSNGCIRLPDWALWKIRKGAALGMEIKIQK